MASNGEFWYEEEPLPPWARRLAHGDYVVGSQLPTKDGRFTGNAVIVSVGYSDFFGCIIYNCITDRGNTLNNQTEYMLQQYFYPPKYVEWRPEHENNSQD